MMNDEKFELTINDLAGSGTYYADIADELRARDTAQREALAQMNAERDQYDELHLESVALASRYKDELTLVQAELEAKTEASRILEHGFQGMRDSFMDIQTQLSRVKADYEANGLELGEALILIGQVLDCRSLEDLKAVRRYLNEFMDRYSLRPVPDVDLAQAEQQEAPKREEEAQGAQAGEFQREDRYIVIKRKDLECLPLDVRMPFILAWSELGPRLPKREYLVIESDWPEYEPTWAAIQARVEGRAALATQPADSVAVNRLRLALVAWDAELAEQDYQLTADDLREKLREIHRDIDRLMPEQTHPAVRGAEHDQ